jgi:hypothetical protein
MVTTYHHILEACKPREYPALLEGARNSGSAALVCPNLIDPCPAEPYFACITDCDAGNDIDKGGLSRPIGTN